MEIYEENNNDIKIILKNENNLHYSVLEVYLDKNWLLYTQVIELKEEIILKNVSSGNYVFKVKNYNYDTGLISTSTTKINIKKQVIPEVDEVFYSLLKSPDLFILGDLLEKRPLSLRYLFIKLRTVLHGSGTQFHKTRFLDICFLLLTNSSVNTAQGLFLLSCVIYGYDKLKLENNCKNLFEKITSLTLPAFEGHYLKGLLYYKVGNYYNAELEFANLDQYKDALLSHQLISLVYKNNYYPDSNLKKYRDYVVVNVGKGNKGVVLISCDLGYYNIYKKLVEQELSIKDAAIHYHVVVPSGYNVGLLQSNKSNNIGLSYEIENVNTRENNRHYKTYYSLVRYLLAEDISKIYDSPVLISDIDIDFSNIDVENLFESISDDECALVFSKLDLPWTAILAGFNLFGKKFFLSEFYKIVCSFMLTNLTRSRDYWMLDQVALNVAYTNSTKETISKIRSISSLKNFPIRQQKENNLLKHEARRIVIDEIINITGQL